MITVKEDVFKKFVENYPRELDTHWVYFCTPEICMYLDSMDYWEGYEDYCGSYCVGGFKESFMGKDREYMLDENALERYGDNT